MPIDHELKAALDAITGETKNAFTDMRAKYDAIRAQMLGIQAQADALDAKSRVSPIADEAGGLDAIVRAISEDAGFKSLAQTGHGRAVIQTKNLLGIETKTVSSGELVAAQAIGGIGDSGRPIYGLVRRLMPSHPITSNAAQFVRETAFTNAASPQVETFAKGESSFDFEPATATVKTIAHWAGISRQLMDDLVEFGRYIKGSLVFGLEKQVELQLLAGDGVGENLDGLIHQATAFDPSLLNLIGHDGYNAADILRAAILQLTEAGFGATGFVVSPRDWFAIETLKNGTQNYLVGDPRRQLSEVLWSRPIVPSPGMAGGEFLAGDFANGAHIRMRQESTLDVSDSHADFFTRNLLALRAETRLALVVSKPGAFVYGSLTASPA